MTLRNHHLREKVKQRDLLCIRRTEFDPNAIQGFLLDFSDSLLLFQQVSDFRLEGYLVLRREDITELKSRSTERFQRELMEVEAVLDQVDFDFRVPIQSYAAFLASRGPKEIIVVEDERPDTWDFVIGTVAKVEEETVHLDHFTAIGRWSKQPLPLPLERITCCQIATNYIQFYERYFGRMTVRG